MDLDKAKEKAKLHHREMNRYLEQTYEASQVVSNGMWQHSEDEEAEQE